MSLSSNSSNFEIFYFEQKEYFGRFTIFLGEKENFGKHFLGEIFSISENNIITVEARQGTYYVWYKP
jgi:hypothetical protein